MRRILLFSVLVVLWTSTALAQVEPAYLYSLSTFAGPLRYDRVRVYVDHDRDETYVLYQGIVRIFNRSGMQTFSFGDDLNLGQILDVVVDKGGDIILLSFKDSKSSLTRCNFRGVPLAAIEVSGLPPGTTFTPNRLVYRNGLFYLATLSTSNVIVVDETGRFQKSIDLMSQVDGTAAQKDGAETLGFTVDKEGSLYFTVPTLFRVFKLAIDGTISSFGQPGSAAGRFGVIAGVAVDSQGDIFVADKLKCVVLAFDKDFKFIREFGYRGPRPENLIQPEDLAIDSKDRLYVSQGRSRGVSVFALNHVQ